MNDIYAKTNSDIKRAHQQFTREFTKFDYEWDDSSGDNEYADGSWVESSSSVQATLRQTTDARRSTDASGTDVEADVDIYLDSDVAVDTARGDETRPSEFLDSVTGIRYEAIDVHYEGALQRIQAVEV